MILTLDMFFFSLKAYRGNVYTEWLVEIREELACILIFTIFQIKKRTSESQWSFAGLF